jgi:hypothetical protein
MLASRRMDRPRPSRCEIGHSLGPVHRHLGCFEPGDVTRLVPSIRHTARQTIPGGIVTRIATIEQQVKASLVRERLLSILAPFFAGGLALVLACSIGLHGVMAYDVVRRSREIAIRIAIGARQESVVWMVVRESLALIVLGATLWTTAALAAGRYVQSQLFGVAPGDPLAIAAAILMLMAVTTAAAYLPARRATRIHWSRYGANRRNRDDPYRPELRNRYESS